MFARESVSVKKNPQHQKDQKKWVQPIVPADIDWRNEQPYSRQFNDVYFSQHNGLDETRYVFLQQNHLRARWQQSNSDFIIAETGFGTGLNFLAACQLWMTTTTQNTLHFVSVDKHPLQKKDIARALNNWPVLAEYADAFLQQYPMLVPGWHRITLYEGRIVLTLYFGEVDTFLEDSQFKADAWFLDGFAPQQNQAMWSDKVYQAISRLSKLDTTFATYTAAGHVRRGLQTAGFTVSKAKGYANKRELLYGHLTQEQALSGLVSDAPWFYHTTGNKPKTVTIIGAGLAGAFTANTFAKRGYQVTVIEAEKGVAQKASGNKQAMIYSRFSPYASSLYDFYHQAYLHSVSCLAGQADIQQTGLLEVAYDQKNQDRLADLQRTNVWPQELMSFLSPEEASDAAGLPIKQATIHMHKGGYVNPVGLCEKLLSHNNIKLHTNLAIKEIKTVNNEWQLFDHNAVLVHKTPVLILTIAEACLQFKQLAYLPLKSIRGQISHIAENENSKRLQMPVCYEGYIAPSQNGEHSLGASFNLQDKNTAVNQKDDIDNINKLKQYLPAIHREMCIDEKSIVSSRVGFRCHSPDYLPVVGPLPDADYFQNNYQGLRYGQLKKNYKQGKFIAGLFLNIAHGSRGVVSTPLSAELLYSYVHNQGIFPVGETVRQALHPARFLIKRIKRNQ